MEFTNTKNGIVWLDTNAYAKVTNMRSELKMNGKEHNIKGGSIERGTFADLKSYGVESSEKIMVTKMIVDSNRQLHKYHGSNTNK